VNLADFGNEYRGLCSFPVTPTNSSSDLSCRRLKCEKQLRDSGVVVVGGGGGGGDTQSPPNDACGDCGPTDTSPSLSRANSFEWLLKTRVS